jgi:glycerol-3-phosphate dehydrogenase
MKRDIAALKETTFDLVILGGGITGAGAALDAVTRGWRVALIDKGDFASGTSSASSKLIHGGLRYLEYGHFGLVHEALQERALLLHNAPHQVAPLRFVLPFYRGQRIPGWKWRLGLTAYDLLAGRANIARSRPCSARFLHQHDPSLRTQNLLGGTIYWDALMDDARLCLTVLETAARHGAVLANYVAAVDFEKHQGTISGVWAEDILSRERFLLRGKVVLNATGPWGDAVARLAGDAGGPYLQPTKGVHLIAPWRPLFAAYLLLHPLDGRVFFVIPWMGKTLIGTTDTYPDADADSLQVQPQEITYLLDGYNAYFDPCLRAEEVMGSFAGLRPLMRASANDPSSLPREFRLVASPSGLVTVVGGKYTTFRQMAESIVDSLSPRLGQRRRSRTKTLPLEGNPHEPWLTFFERTAIQIQRQYPLREDSTHSLLHRYGNRVFDVLKLMCTVPDGFQQLHPEEPDLIGEQAYQRTEEMAYYCTDLFLRRSRIGMYRPELLTSG